MKTLFYNLYIVLFSMNLLSCNNEDGFTGIVDNKPHGGFSSPLWSNTDIIMFGHTPINENGQFNLDSSGWYYVEPTDRKTFKKFFFTGEYGIFDDFIWSNDSKWIVAEKDGQIFKLSFPLDKIIQLTNDSLRKFFPSWSPDGSSIVYIYDDGPFESRGLYIISSQGGKGSLLKNINKDKPSGVEPVWSPNGSTIAFVGYRDYYGFAELCLLDTTSSAVKNIVVSESVIFHPRFSVDGKKIVFAMRPSQSGQLQIWSVNIDGTNLRQITVNGGLEPAWSPDGSSIIYTKSSPNQGEDGTLWIISENGSNDHLFIN